ncbi:MAG: hypothetical protein WAK44_27115, partial [Trebonia sp.]|uniref:hypothetical protein n=1 Tax=Trebonia sp. TaxID=2767075 RepID=UPI003BAF8A90
ALPVLAVVALAAALTVPGGLLYGHSERTVASPVVGAPWQFNPLVPYASFGWLPPGYSESLANGTDFNPGTTSATDFVSREAAAPAAGRLLSLQVEARDMCAVNTVTDLRAIIRAHGQDQVACIDAAFTVTGAAPNINGRSAFWTDHGSGVAWEYAPDAWAELSLSGIAAGGGKPLPPTAATQALLQKVAAHVAYGGTTPLTFAFRLSGELPAGWQVWRASFDVSGGRMFGTGITVGPSVDTSALSISASIVTGSALCESGGGQSSYVSRLGVQWLYIVQNLPDDVWQRLCATAPVDGLTGVNITMDMNNPESGTPLPGSAQLGGALGVLSRLLLLGPSPAAWIANPVN